MPLRYRAAAIWGIQNSHRSFSSERFATQEPAVSMEGRELADWCRGFLRHGSIRISSEGDDDSSWPSSCTSSPHHGYYTVLETTSTTTEGCVHTKRGCSWWVSKGSSGNWAIGKGAGFNQGNASSWTIHANTSWLLEWILFSVTPWGKVLLVSSSSWSETLHTQQLCHSWTLKPFASDVNLAPCSF